MVSSYLLRIFRNQLWPGSSERMGATWREAEAEAQGESVDGVLGDLVWNGLEGLQILSYF